MDETTTTTTIKQCPRCGDPESFGGGYCPGCWPRLGIPEEAWDDDEGDGSRLSVPIVITPGYLLHVTAFAVTRVCDCGEGHGRMARDDMDDAGCSDSDQEADTANPDVRAEYEQLSIAAAQQEPWRELTIRGRTYVLFASAGS